MKKILWFRHDLRIEDNDAFNAACRDGEVLPIFIYDQGYWELETSSSFHLNFTNQSLDELNQDLTKKYHTKIHVFYGDSVKILNQLIDQHQIQSIHTNQIFRNKYTLDLDRRCEDLFKEKHVTWHQSQQFGIQLENRKRNYWSSQWNNFIEFDPIQSEAKCKFIHINTPKIEKIKTHQIDGSNVQKGGRKEGLILLDKFLNDKLDNYLQNISGPNNSDKYCSRLSPHLTYGTLSVKEIYKKLKDFKYKCEKQGLKYNKRGLSAFSSRLSWRCHFIQKLEDQPSIENKCMHSSYEGMREKKSNTDKLKAWETGFTGFPFVDACMRSLTYNGWITFRMRAMLTSFASYDLWIDWRESGYVLARLFTDYEPGIHYSQLQMQSGVTGINNLRIYNPIKQSIEHDKEGEFIKKWVPELKNVPSMFIHEPWKMSLEEQTKYSCILGNHYPLPIVDHKEAVRMARDKISKVRKDDNYKAKSKNVYNKHGSRKKVKTVRPVRIKKTTDQLVLI